MKKKYFVITFIFICFCHLTNGQIKPFPASDYQVEQWRVMEIILTSDKVYDKPLDAVEVTATFSGPDGKIIKRPAFWDGGKIWKIRFAPTAIGLWNVKTECSDIDNKGLTTVAKSIHCIPYKGNLAIYKHGFLKVSENKRYFEYADGQPFFYLGDTHWLYIHERFNTSNVKGVASQFKYVVDKRIKQGFTVYQSEAIQHPHARIVADGGSGHNTADEEPHCNFRDGFDQSDLPGFKNIDQKFKYIADAGLVNANSSVCWALDPADFPDSYSEEYMYKLGKYWSARYGAYPVLWTIAQEIDKNMYKRYDSVTIKKWFAVANAINDFDDYHHPLSAHMENLSRTVPETSWWADKSYHSWWAIQWQKGMDPNITAIARLFWNDNRVKPAILYESEYEGYWTDTRGAREAGYAAFQNGLYGYGYGANGVWNDAYSRSPADYGTDSEMPVRYINWFDGANMKGAEQLGYLKKFYEAVKWWELIPRFHDSKWSSFVDQRQSFIASNGQKTFVVYFANNVVATGELRNLEKNATYIAKWYNTRNGDYLPIKKLKTNTGNWTVPEKPNDEDWILLVTQ